MAITGIGNSYHYMYDNTYTSPKNEAVNKREPADTPSAQAGNQCAKDTQKAFKKSYENGLKSAQANARAIGAKLVNYSESWSIDGTGNITMMASATVTSDTGHRADKTSVPKKRQNDSVDISAEGRNALREKTSKINSLSQIGDIRKLSSITSGSYGIMNEFEKLLSELGSDTVSDESDVAAVKARFEKEDGPKTDSFDRYVNKMASAYQLMKDRIEEKYDTPDRQKEYYSAADGSTQEMTKEKELEMLDNAYTTHSEFMAASTQIWSELQDFKAQITSHSGKAEPEAPAAEKQKADIKEPAYRAFLSAISDDNRSLLSQKTGSLNHFRLDLDISSSERNLLNGIWDYYANMRQ